MILCNISDAGRYRSLGRTLAAAIDWLTEHAADNFATGISVIERAGEPDITVKCEEPALVPREDAALEAHRRFIDIHVPLKGTETIGWAPVSSLRHVRTPYDEEKDVAFFGDSAHSMLHVRVGQMAVFFPEDAHAPNIGLGRHRKLCIKVPVD